MFVSVLPVFPENEKQAKFFQEIIIIRRYD